MRNLKRALSLTLASVMLLGMMVVGAGAAGFPDVDDDNDNVEAIEVLQAIEVMVGNADTGNFEPDRSVTRTEMAVVMANLLKLDYQYYEASCPFWDVPTWARPYVGACYANKIVSGYGDGTYGALDPITPVQAASMMMRALGYFQYAEDYQDGFETATVRQGTQVGLFDGVGSSATADMTRNQVARMALNALRSEMVTFTGTAGVTIGDATVGYRAEYTPRTSTEAKYNAIEGRTSDVASDFNHKGQYYVQLGEELYNGDLRLSNTTDVFERPARYWEYDGKGIGTYYKEELVRAEYTQKVTGRTLYEKLGASVLKEYTLDIAIDGVSTKDKNASLILGDENHGPWFDEADLNRNNNVGVGGTGNGVLTQVFVDNDNKIVTIAIINTYLAKADEDFDTRTEDVDIDVYGIEKVAGTDEYVKITSSSPTDRNHSSDFTITADDFALVKDVQDGDPLLVTVAKGEVQSAAIPEVLSAVTISSFSRGSSVTTDGTKYDYSSAAEYDWEVLDQYTQGNTVNLKDIQYNVYLDKYSYAIGVDIVEAVNNYAFVTAIQRTGSHLSNMYADANVIFLDGTAETVRVDLSKSELPPYRDGLDSILNTWTTFSKNSNGAYTLKQVKDATNNVNNVPGGSSNKTKIAQAWTDPVTVSKINRTHLSLIGGGNSTVGFNRVYGNDNTVYLTAKLAELNHNSDAAKPNYGVIKGVADVITGVNNVDLEVWSLDDARKEAEDTKVGGTIPSTDDGDRDFTENDMFSHTSHGTYTLYNRDGYVIAAMVVGNNGVNNRGLVYVHSASGAAGVKDETDNGKSESRAAGDDMYTWTREVTVNGEKVLLTEVGDQLTYLDEMERGQWYQVSYNSNGEVIAVANATGAGWYDAIDTWRLKGHSVKDSKDIAEYVTDINWLEDSLDEYSSVLYHESFTTGHPYMIGNTLYATTKNKQGFYVTNDVNVALFQWERNEDWKGEWTTGATRLKSIVDNLNTKNGENYEYTISAIVDGTGATTVIIRDWTNTYERPGISGKAQELRLYGNLFTADSYVTGKSNAVVSAEGGEIKPIRTDRDAYGAYTAYSIKAGDRVAITDYDIVSGFGYITNLLDLVGFDPDLRVRTATRTISFIMPNTTTWIVGRDEEIKETIVGEKGDDESLDNVAVTFDGKAPGVSLKDMSAGDPVSIVIGKALGRAAVTLKAYTKYTVTLGDPAREVEVTSDASSKITITYRLTHTDILNGYVEVSKLVEGWKDDEPIKPSEENTPVESSGLSISAADKSVIEAEDVFKGVTPYLQQGLTYEFDEATKTLKVTGKINTALSKEDSSTNIPGFGTPSSLFPAGATSTKMAIVPIKYVKAGTSEVDWLLFAVGDKTTTAEDLAELGFNGDFSGLNWGNTPISTANLSFSSADEAEIEREDVFNGVCAFLQQGLTYKFDEATNTLTVTGDITKYYSKDDSTTEIPGFQKPNTYFPGTTQSTKMAIIPIQYQSAENDSNWLLLLVGDKTTSVADVNGLGFKGDFSKLNWSGTVPTPIEAANLTFTKADIQEIESDPAFTGVSGYLQQGLTYRFDKATNTLTVTGDITKYYSKDDSTTEIPGFQKPNTYFPEGTKSTKMAIIPIAFTADAGRTDWLLFAIGDKTTTVENLKELGFNGDFSKLNWVDMSEAKNIPVNRENLKIDANDKAEIEGTEAFKGVTTYLQEGLTYAWDAETETLSISGAITTAFSYNDTTNIPGFGTPQSQMGSSKSSYMAIVPIEVGDGDWLLWLVGNATSSVIKVTTADGTEINVKLNLDWGNYKLADNPRSGAGH